ncbi:MAG TPA: hypothetical protein VFO60_11450 [Candidatus Dormibacteraeota bacterium]|nr:hypothetical protein [Candidatus Dormibacteraeota bacterium]
MTELEILDSIERSAADAAETGIGAAALVANGARRRGAAARARRRGEEITEEVGVALEQAVDAALNLPERVLHDGIRRIRIEADRDDPLGAAARTVLLALHGPASTAAGFFTRLEQETVPHKAKRRTRKPAAAAGTRRATGPRTRATTRGRTRRTA